MKDNLGGTLIVVGGIIAIVWFWVFMAAMTRCPTFGGKPIPGWIPFTVECMKPVEEHEAEA